MSTPIWVQGPQSSRSVATMPAAASASAGAARRGTRPVSTENFRKLAGLAASTSRM